ncbi:MAG TPA: hypothetical protein VK171_13075 [Fimbriimonas sp.]|nr:hypothetical protein [Fimbriimonas sp.]
MKKIAFVLAISSLLGSAFAQQTPMTPAPMTKVGPKTTAQIYAESTIVAPQRRIINKEKEDTGRENLPQNPLSPASSQYPPMLNDKVVPLSKVIDRGTGPLFSLSTGFDGPQKQFGVDPPDTIGDVSETQVVVGTNEDLAIYNKSGGGVLSILMDTFFSPVLATPPSGGASFTSDPRVRFDRTSGRWFVNCINVVVNSGGNVVANNRCMIAVSNSSTINWASGWTFYFFTPRLTTQFFDYPMMGVDNNAVYIGGNMFTAAGSFTGCDAYVIPKAPLLVGGAASVFSAQVSPASGEGAYSPQGVTNNDSTTTEGYFVGVSNAAFGRLVVRRVTTPGTAPAISGNLLVTVPATQFPGTVSTPGGAVDAIDDRLFNASFSNGTIWAAHNFQVTNTGVATTAGGRYGSRWYQLGSLTTTPALVQSGTVFDSAATPLSYWIPGVASNKQGHAVLGSSRANSTTNVGSGWAARLTTDAAGTMSAPAAAKLGTGAYTPGGGRWGDYSNVAIDPADGMSFWSFQEYGRTSTRWGTWVQKILAPAPTVTSLSPNNATQGQTLNVTVTGTGLFDPGAGYPNHLTANFGANITVNSVTWANATTATVNITVGAGAATGARTVSVTNPDGQSASSSFTVNTGNISIAGTINLPGWIGTGAGVGAPQFVFELRNATTNAVLATQTVTLGAGNTFNWSVAQPGNTQYKLWIKGVKRFLGVVQTINTNASGVSGLAYTLPNGDIDGNNIVSTSDYNALRAAWGATSSNANWATYQWSDLDGNGFVGTADYNLMRASWGSVGNP